MKYSIINYKMVNENDNFRLDADFYYPDYLIYLKQIRKHEVYYLTNILHPTEIKRVYCKKGIQILLAQNVRNNELNFSNIVFMDESKKDDLKRNKLHYDDVVLTRSGANFGQSASFKLNKDIYACADVLIIKNTNEIKGGYLSTFLNSKQGKALLNRGSYGMAQPHIAPSYLYKLPIPRFNIFFEKIIDQLINKSETIKMNALNLYSQSKQILISELDLQNWEPKHKLVFVKNYSDTKVSGRIDAKYFQPIYFNTERLLKEKFEAKSIGEYDFLDITTGQYTNSYVSENEGNPYIRGTDLFNASVNTDNLVYISKSNQVFSKKAIEGDVVVTRVGTIGISSRIPKECNGGTISDNLIRIRIKDQQKINSYYLALYLNTELGKNFMIRASRGSVQQRLNQETLKEIILPIININKQKEIANTIIHSQNQQNISKSLLEIAKKSVEIAIEKDEGTAEKWINSEINKLGVKIDD